jgi:hypothetical protein
VQITDPKSTSFFKKPVRVAAKQKIPPFLGVLLQAPSNGGATRAAVLKKRRVILEQTLVTFEQK